jgi:hypothetical protein
MDDGFSRSEIPPLKTRSSITLSPRLIFLLPALPPPGFRYRPRISPSVSICQIKYLKNFHKILYHSKVKLFLDTPHFPCQHFLLFLHTLPLLMKFPKPFFYWFTTTLLFVRTLSTSFMPFKNGILILVVLPLLYHFLDKIHLEDRDVVNLLDCEILQLGGKSVADMVLA